jgi:hypothetical protein
VVPAACCLVWYDDPVYVTGSGTIGDLLGDMIAYRSLRPCDGRLASFRAPAVAPRKIDIAYAQVVGQLLQQARYLEAPDTQIQQIIMIGDNAPTDGAAFDNLCAVNGWSGTALIVSEQPDGTVARAEMDAAGHLYLGRWSALRGWAQSARVDQATVVLVDVDKTLLGARGRNDAVIDCARAVAMREAIAEMLGGDSDPGIFEEARRTFNDRAFHTLTGDNQDYVAYLALVVASGMWTTARLASAIRNGEFVTIDALIARVEAANGQVAARLQAVQRPIVERIRLGDPTPFKAFREREFLETVARMNLPADLAIETRLGEELLLTGEVIEAAETLRRRGALLFALSDKPDEAALPTPALRAANYVHLHHTPTHIVTTATL